MTTLMIYGGETDATAPGLRTGGLPLVPDGFAWPLCRSCDGAMQFLLHLPLDADGAVVSVFMCQNNPGLCDEWDPFAGGNRALLFRAGGLAPATVPEHGETLLGAISALDTDEAEGEDYGEALTAWADGDKHRAASVLGQLGGEPAWLQNDETPQCPACAAHMRFEALFEEGYEHRTAANFGGGGLGYVFSCVPCREAAFLWQR